jgi:hypothetical protein
MARDNKRWSANRKKEMALRRMRRETFDALSCELGVEIYRLQAWDQTSFRWILLRMDNGSQTLSDHFQNQIKFWGIAPSFVFPALLVTKHDKEKSGKERDTSVIGHLMH